MLAEVIRVLTEDGPVTIQRNAIVAIDPVEEGTKIVVDFGEPQVYISVENYDQVVMSYLS